MTTLVAIQNLCPLQTPNCQLLPTANCQLLTVNSCAVRGMRLFDDRFRHRRMRVDGADQLLDGAFQLQRQRRFGNEFGRARSDHVDAEDLVVLLVGDDLHEALRLAGDLGAPEYAELERADADVVAALLRLGLGEADAA